MRLDRIFLHAGLNKTGTTSIQRCLFENRFKLLEHEISYWGISANHSLPLRFSFDPEERPAESYGAARRATAVRRFSSAEAIFADLRRALESSRQKFVISGEGISALPRDALARLKAFLEQFTRKITVVIYVREPQGLIHSTIQQHLKRGKLLDEFADMQLLYRERIEKFFEEFGRGNVVIRRFGTEYFVNKDLMSDFFAAIEEDPELARTYPARHDNTSLSARGALVLDAINRATNQRPPPWFIQQFLRPVFSSPPFRASREMLERALLSNKEDIDWMSSELGVSFTAGQHDRREPDRTETSGVDPDVAQLISRMIAEIDALKGGSAEDASTVTGREQTNGPGKAAAETPQPLTARRAERKAKLAAMTAQQREKAEARMAAKRAERAAGKEITRGR